MNRLGVYVRFSPAGKLALLEKTVERDTTVGQLIVQGWADHVFDFYDKLRPRVKFLDVVVAPVEGTA